MSDKLNPCLLYTSSYQDWINNGNNPQEFNPQTALDVEAFIKEFNENYIDKPRFGFESI